MVIIVLVLSFTSPSLLFHLLCKKAYFFLLRSIFNKINLLLMKQKHKNCIIMRRCTYRSSRPEVFCKKGVLKNSQNSQKNTFARASLLIKFQAAPATLLKKRPWHRCFPKNFAKFLRTHFFIEHLCWLVQIYGRACLWK